MQRTDLRSDTVTMPSPGMRAAMAAAEVGDDVLGEDPTVRALEHRCAALCAKPAGLFVPSGTMANLIACMGHTQPGDEVLLQKDSHMYRYEGGGFAAVAGVSVALLQGTDGVLDADEIRVAVRAQDVHFPRSRLVWLENSHNVSGGLCYSLGALEQVRRATQALGLKTHMDGARLWNACVARGYALTDVGPTCDSISMCFSKGLGCPVGSVLVGDTDFIDRARHIRKRLGGGMRQAGHLAAAALFALDHHRQRLGDDHNRARSLASGLGDITGLSPATPETNIVLLDSQTFGSNAAQLVSDLKQLGVLAVAVGAQRVRLVTHLDIDDRGIETTLRAFKTLFDAQTRPNGRPTSPPA